MSLHRSQAIVEYLWQLDGMVAARHNNFTTRKLLVYDERVLGAHTCPSWYQGGNLATHKVACISWLGIAPRCESRKPAIELGFEWLDSHHWQFWSRPCNIAYFVHCNNLVCGFTLCVEIGDRLCITFLVSHLSTDGKWAERERGTFRSRRSVALTALVGRLAAEAEIALARGAYVIPDSVGQSLGDSRRVWQAVSFGLCSLSGSDALLLVSC